MRKFGIFLLIIVVLGAIMFFTNPTETNFSNYLERTSSGNVSRYAAGSQGSSNDLTDPDTPTVSDYRNAVFEKQDYYIYSIFEITSPSSLRDSLYIGVFKIFIRLN